MSEVRWPLPVDVLVDGLDIANVIINLVIAGVTIGTLVWAIRSTRRQISLATDEIAIATGERAEQARERARQSERDRQQQAEHVAAWTEQEPVWEDHGLDEQGEPITQIVNYRRSILVINTSNAPIWDVAVEYQWSERDGETIWDLPILPPTDRPQKNWAPGLMSDHENRRLVAVRFRDAAGYVWRRDETGELHLVENPGPVSAPGSSDAGA